MRLVKQVFILLLIAFFTSQCNNKAGNNSANKTTENSKPENKNKPFNCVALDSDSCVYLSLYHARTDISSGLTTGELLVFAKYVNGKFIEIVDYNNLTDGPTGERLCVLQNHKDFDLFYNNRKAGRLRIDNIDTSSYDCSDLVIGNCENIISEVVLEERRNEYMQSRYGSVSGNKVNYFHTNFISLSSNHKIVLNHQEKAKQLDSSQIQLITDDLKNKFHSFNDTISLTQIEIKCVKRIHVKEIDDPLYVSIAICNDTIKHLFLSTFNIFTLDNYGIVTVFNQFENVDYDGWGDGYEFIGQIDINNDGNDELIFQVDGYESSGIEIYSYENGRFIKIFETSLYGC